jgi:trk system potassium uptake protein TrkA
MAKKEVGVVGLGKFGFALAEKLADLGHRVVGVDRSEARVKNAQGVLDQVFQADATDATALKQLGFGDLSHVAVSIGQSMEASILITLNLKELGCEQVWVKAVSEQHQKVLDKLGADLVVFPERFVAQQLAHRLAVPGLTAYLPLESDVVLQEISVDKWAGKSLRDLDLRRKSGLQVVAVRRHGSGSLQFVPDADRPLEAGDTLVALGPPESLEEATP